VKGGVCVDPGAREDAIRLDMAPGSDLERFRGAGGGLLDDLEGSGVLGIIGGADSGGMGVASDGLKHFEEPAVEEGDLNFRRDFVRLVDGTI
jgi:hypothetical protein